MSSHAKFSPSAAHRWLVCPGSLTLPQGEDRESEYAALGTAAHDLAAACLKLGLDPHELIGVESYGHPIDEEMADAVAVYVNYCRSLMSRPEAEVGIEYHATHPEIPDYGGTVDFRCWYVDEVGQLCLEVVDYKHGSGKTVEAEEETHAYQGTIFRGNPQFLSYAIFAVRERYPHNEAFTSLDLIPVRVTVVQPRKPHHEGPIRHYDASGVELGELERLVAKEAESHSPTFKAGEHCSWCPAKLACPILRQHTLDAAAAEFDPTADVDSLVEIMELAPAIEAYLGEIKSHLFARLMSGETVPGYKLVESYSNRAWKADDRAILNKLKTKGFGKKEMVEEKLKSPAQMEKAIKEARERGVNVKVEAVNELVTRTLKPRMAKASSKSPEYEVKSAADEFADAAV